jgi:hypothetical protein
MLPSDQLLGIITFSHILWNTGCKISAARTGSILKSYKIYRIQQEGKDSNTYEQEGFYSKRSRKYSFKSENGIYLPGN